MNNKITLFAIDGTGTELQTYVDIFNMCKKEFPVASYKIVTANKNYENKDNIEIFNINKLNYKDYQYFCIKNINKYIQTDFAITMQSDGFIHNGKNWTDEFLNYDYIGEPWIHKTKGIEPFGWVKSISESVGCGGFSLRSKKLLSLCENIEERLLSHLIYTPELANQFCAGMTDFSYDRLNETFGFHGREYIEKVLSKYEDKHNVNCKDTFNIYKKD